MESQLEPIQMTPTDVGRPRTHTQSLTPSNPVTVSESDLAGRLVLILEDSRLGLLVITGT